MGLLDSLFGGGKDPRDIQDFVQRYQQGPPSEGYTGDEVRRRYDQVATGVPEGDYVEAAKEAFARMSPSERREFAGHLTQSARQSNVDMGGMDLDPSDRRAEDPDYLAQVTGRVHQRDPGLLGQLFGGGGGGAGGLMDNPVAKAALAGIAAMAAKRMMDRR